MQPEYLKYFKEICAIPHGSGNTAAVSSYCETFAKEMGLRCIREECGNVLIFKPGQNGGENAAPVILQGHLDMVCVRTEESNHDFLTDALTLEENGDFLSAKGTSLGGDDGIAVAYALAILADKTRMHPPLQVVFTIDEETGMEGAAALDVSPLTAKMLINVDSEEEGTLLAACAGGMRADLHFSGERTDASDTFSLVSLQQFAGGHSGTEIGKGRQNAILLLSKLLKNAGVKRIASLSGGSADNAIPSGASAVVTLTNAQRAALEAAFSEEKAQLCAEDGGAVLTVAPAAAETAFTEADSARLLALLARVPNGVISMSDADPTLVQTSLNLGTAETDGNRIAFGFALRSSVEKEKAQMLSNLTACANAHGVSVTTYGAYPAWEYKKESRLRDTFCRVFKAQTGKKLAVTQIHAGLECGIFCGKKPELDCVSVGPDIFDIHSTDERLSLSSAKRTFNLLCGVLRALCD